MHLNIRRLGSPEPSSKVTGKITKIYFWISYLLQQKLFHAQRQIILWFVKTCIMIFSWWHKNVFTTIFLLLYLLLPIRSGPTCHRDTHQVFTYLILSLHPPGPSFPTHKALFSSVGRQQEMDGGEGTWVEARWGRPAPPPGRSATPLGPI
jgi:hypothetical protein